MDRLRFPSREQKKIFFCGFACCRDPCWNSMPLRIQIEVGSHPCLRVMKQVETILRCFEHHWNLKYEGFHSKIVHVELVFPHQCSTFHEPCLSSIILSNIASCRCINLSPRALKKVLKNNPANQGLEHPDLQPWHQPTQTHQLFFNRSHCPQTHKASGNVVRQFCETCHTINEDMHIWLQQLT